MPKVLKIAVRNLARFGRRTLLTASLITLGIVGVLLFYGFQLNPSEAQAKDLWCAVVVPAAFPG